MTNTKDTAYITAHLRGIATTRFEIMHAMLPEIFTNNIFADIAEWIETDKIAHTNAYAALSTIACRIENMADNKDYTQTDINRAKESYAYLDVAVSYAMNELYKVYEGEDKNV